MNLSKAARACSPGIFPRRDMARFPRIKGRAVEGFFNKSQHRSHECRSTPASVSEARTRISDPGLLQKWHSFKAAPSA